MIRGWARFSALVLAACAITCSATPPSKSGQTAPPGEKGQTAAQSPGSGPASAQPGERGPASAQRGGIGPAAPRAAALTGAPVPFGLRIEPIAIPGMPGLHSMVTVMDAEGRVVLLAGRRGGLHGFPQGGANPQGAPSFPRAEANDEVIVVDPAAGRVLGRERVDGLPPELAGQLKATNMQFTVRNDWLYLVGGYGQDPRVRSPVTLQRVTAVRLSALVNAVLDPGIPLDTRFAQAHTAAASHLALAMAGGHLDLVGDRFLLVFGHRYDGEYDPGGSVVTQRYSESVRAFRFNLADGARPALTVNYLGMEPNAPLGGDPDNAYHRRDLNVGPALAPDGSEQIVAYGGVFKGGRIEGYLSPMIITPSAQNRAGVRLVQEGGTQQLLSQYECANIPLFDARSGIMYTTFFGGISQFHWNEAQGRLVHDPIVIDPPKRIDDGVPFINSVSTLRRGGQSPVAAHQYLHRGVLFHPAGAEPLCTSAGRSPVPAPYGGAMATFVAAQGVPRHPNGVLRLEAMTSPTPIGWIFGGIAATEPYVIGKLSCASDRVYRVTLDPTRSDDVVELQAPPAP